MFFTFVSWAWVGLVAFFLGLGLGLGLAEPWTSCTFFRLLSEPLFQPETKINGTGISTSFQVTSF